MQSSNITGVEYKEAQIYLEEGLYELRLEFMQGGGGKFLSLNWKPEELESWAVIPSSALLHSEEQQKIIGNHYVAEAADW